MYFMCFIVLCVFLMCIRSSIRGSGVPVLMLSVGGHARRVPQSSAEIAESMYYDLPVSGSRDKAGTLPLRNISSALWAAILGKQNKTVC